MTFNTHAARAARAAIRAMAEPVGTVVYTPAGGAAVGVDDAHFRNSFQSLTSLGETGADTSGPAIKLMLEDLPDVPAAEDQITARGIAYEVISVERDDAGGAWLRLVEMVA